MADTSARMLRLLSLLQSRREWTGAALCERLEVSPRTVRRDVDGLRRLGYPVHVTKGPGGGYRLGAGASLPPLILDDEQAVAVAVALQTAPATVSGIGEAAERALATITQVMPSRLGHQIDAVQVTSISNPWDLAAPPVEYGTLLAVGNAVRSAEVIRFDYSGVDSDAGPLRVEPHHLVFWTGRWYLVGWEIDTSAWRTFRVDRITPRVPTGPRFTRRALPEPDVATYVRSQFDRGDTAEHWPCRGEVVLDIPAGIVARWAPGGAVVEAVTPTTSRLILGAWSWVGLAALVGTFAADIEVVGPPELRAACATLSRRYAAAAEGRRH